MKHICELKNMVRLAASRVFLCCFLFAMPSFAEESGSAVVPGGGTVSYVNASYIDHVGDELLIVFTNSAVFSSFTLPGTTSARILAVGGGGGGGGAMRSSATTYAKYGGGGGGGAGSFVETNGLFGAATYTVGVGAGGAGGNSTTSMSTVTPGEAGGVTTISMGDDPWISVAGGGGGGAVGGTGDYEKGKGGPGGSGGGGSQYSADGKTSPVKGDGGLSSYGPGNAGGDGDKDLLGGGGGGASGAGRAASEGGAGGAGKTSNITGDVAYYAAGGGGGNRNGTAGAGGTGGGGAGGSGTGAAGDATTYGSGGGGGDRGAGGGGAGAGGVVIVRIAASVLGGLERPSSVNFTYDGNVHTAILPNAFYGDITGDNTATDIGVYMVTVSLATGVTWADGGRDDVTVVMTISPEGSTSGTEYVTGAPVVYAGASEVVRVGEGDDLLLRFDGAGSFSLPGSSRARILAAGGGGGGGGAMRSSATTYPKYGGGGGGGAGGFIETNAIFGAATYAVSVGAGGAGGNSTTSIATVTPGESGGMTVILKDGETWLFAAGGGGGGAVGVECGKGGSGGSGGGGSQYSADGKTSPVKGDGGSSSDGHGNAGGAGDKDLLGGGGGGAGGAGKAASEGGAGGAGKTSDITGGDVYYAAGGGGAGGSGTGTAGNATTYGSGGGGGDRGAGGRAGSGTNGVVYVRISTAMFGEFVKPFDISLEYDRNVHTSYVSNVFYDVVGQNTGTTAGVYVVTATLKNGGLWPDSDDGDPVTVSMTINPRSVTFSDLTISGWEYGSAPSVPTCSVSPAWVEPIYEYAASKDAEEWSATPPEAVGSYWVRVRVSDDGNYSYVPQFAQFDVSKVHVAFSELKQRDWMFGTPDDDTPKPTCKVTPSWVEPRYEYEDDDGNWGDKKPTTVGTHHVRVGPPDFENYEFDGYEPAEFKIVKGLGNLFTDYVELSITYTAAGSDPMTLLDYPLAVTLADNLPPGFLYSRAGKTGNDLAFTDEDGELIYQYYVEQWTENGVSTLYVRIPAIVSGETQKIRLYWHLRADADPPPHNPGSEWIAGIGETRAQTSHQPEQSVMSPVCRSGWPVNYWTKLPLMSKTLWDSTDSDPGVITQDAELAFGEVSRVITNIVTGTGYDALPTNVGGSYRVIYAPKDTDDYEPISCYVDFTILGHSPYDNLGVEGEDLTRSGRVLLVNDDTAEGHVVSGQAYWRERTVDRGDGTILTNDLFWTHTGTFEDWPDMPNRLAGISHRLFSIGPIGATNTIWRLEDVIIGNQLRDSASGYTASLCSLPWSLTALDGTTYAAREKAMTSATSSYMMMRNKISPCIFSPCYTNGIGTIYFDVVNGFKCDDYMCPPSAYRIVVEVATETDEGKPPTDENAARSDMTGIEGELGKIGYEKWIKYDMVPLMRDGGATSFTAIPTTNDLALGVTTGRSSNNFYRVCVRVNRPGLVRFRIRRVSCNYECPRGCDGGDLILVDNIVVSPAPDMVELSPYGVYDPSRRGNITLGQEGAMTVPFPSVTDAEVCPRAKATVYSNGVSDVDPATFASLARIHYQWHYLDQATNEWKALDLSPSDNFTSPMAMEIPAEEGDVAWWYEAFVQAPYYSYFDYSGLGAALTGDDGKALYTEEITAVTNNNGGANWFLRLRQGKSNWETFRIYVRSNDPDGHEKEECVDMEVFDDHIWRGYLRTPITSETLKVRFEGCNLQTPGATEYAMNRKYFTLADSVVSLPHSSLLADIGEERWETVTNDAATEFLMFQIDDRSLGLSIVHADYQNFNSWNDANRGGNEGKFVGTSWLTAHSMAYAEDFAWWHASKETNEKYWVERFSADSSVYNMYEPFTSAFSPNGFAVGNGQWVYGYARDPNSGMALQMESQGKGYIQFVNAPETPRGLESIKFNARLGQAIEFDDFSYYDGSEKAYMTNYTFMTKAAYDINMRRDFSGNGSLSLVAFYRQDKGCYEFRVEQYDAAIYNGEWQGPGRRHRLSLYRWAFNSASGKMTPELLGSGIVDGGTTDTSMLTTRGVNGNYGFLYISVKDTGTATELSAGVSRAVFAAQSPVPRTSTQNIASMIVSIVDSSEKRLKNGTYGVLSANCPGRFVCPQYSKTAATMPTTAKTFVVSSKNFAFPVVSAITTCQGDIDNDLWVVNPRRAVVFQEYASNYGFATPALSQTIEVYTAPLGTTDWELLATTNVTSFKYFSEPIELKPLSLDDCAVKIAVGENGMMTRNDIVIDDIELKQWRGESYTDDEGLRYFTDTSIGSPTNFVFTQVWNTTNEWGSYCSRLSAHRSKASVPTSIRSPLMDGMNGHGIGLGMVTFTYENAQTNVNLLVQIATNGVSRSILRDITGRTADDTMWTTVANFDFSGVDTVGRLSGTRSVYLGLHGVVGAVRIVLDPECVAAVAGSTCPDAFGEIDITGILVRDEPDIDETSWWGWNIRTTSENERAYIGDRSGNDLFNGLSLALNNSVTDDIIVEDASLYPQHLPFLQTPTFPMASAGEVSFKARKYSASDAPTRVALFGADSGAVADDAQWRLLHVFDVDADRFRQYSYKLPSRQGYNAFRFAVTGVQGVTNVMPDPDAPYSPLRVMLDEVSVSEAVRPKISVETTDGKDEDLYVEGDDVNVAIALEGANTTGGEVYVFLAPQGEATNAVAATWLAKPGGRGLPVPMYGMKANGSFSFIAGMARNQGNGYSFEIVLCDQAEYSPDHVIDVHESDSFQILCASMPPEILDVTAKQRYPWNGKVDVFFEVVGNLTAGLASWDGPVLVLTATNRTDGACYKASASAMSGDIGTAAGMHHVVWDLNAQGLDFKSDDVVFTVAYETSGALPTYCVIGLSEGADAASYPVSYLAEVPEGGWTDEYKTTKLVLRLIESGSIPTHDAAITKPFYMSVFEVTQKQYELVTGSNPSAYKGDMRPVEQVSWNTIRGNSSTYNWPNVTGVDPNSFMGRIQTRTGLSFDLPTQAQWEYACRAGTSSSYNNGGNAENDLKQLGRYYYNRSDGKGGYSDAHTTVGSYLPNAWGLYDMHGNVWEWCLDWPGGSLSGNDPIGSSLGSFRAERGGSWSDDAYICTSSYRYSGFPSDGYDFFGFRLVRTLSSADQNEICSGSSASVAIDLRVAPVVNAITVSWDAAWVGGDANATVIIADGESELRRETGTGEFAYAPSRAGRHELTYTTYVDGVAQEEVYSATVYSQWKYELDGGGAFITETTQTSGAVVVPSEIDGYPVTGIAEGVFDDCSGVTKVMMPGRATKIWPQGDGLEPLRPYDVTLSGGSFWVNDGAAMRSGKIGNGESSVIEASVEGPGKLSFRWKASSENYDGEVYDYAYLSIDGVPQGWLENYRIRGVAIGGETEWTNVVVGVLGDGPHTIRWTYCKDEVDESPVGEDCAWLDDVAWQPLTCKPTIDSDDVEDGGTTDKAFASIRITADEGADIYYTLDGTDPTTNSIRYVGSFVVECMSATIRAVAAIGSYTSEVASFSFTRLPYSPAECLGVEGASVATGASDAAWGRVLGDSAHDGIAALKSGAVGDGETSSVVMTVAGPGEVAFWWKVSSEISRNRKYDYVSFRVDGSELSWLGGEKGWTNEVFEVGGGGLHTLEWVYLKNDNGLTQGQDCAWLDDVVWTPSEVIPAIAPDAVPEVVTNAIEEAGFADEAVKEAIGGSAVEYAAFKEWAGSVKGAGSASIAVAGEVAVVANTNAAAAYLLGAERLFENAPKIEFEEVAVGDGEIVDAGASTSGHQVGSVVTVTVIVKDGEEAVKCAAEKVKSLFRATSDLGDWNGAAKLEPEVSIEATDDPTTMRFKVTPGDGTSPRAFLQIRK